MAQEKDLLRLLFVGDFYSNDIEKVSFSSELEREINASNIVFCNFSNLRIEFANVIESETTKTIEINGKKEVKKILSNHTIYLKI